VRSRHPDYYAKAVPSFGVPRTRLLVVGLAPGLHGANRTGRPFTGDHAGILLYATLHRFGFATRAQSVSADDGLELIECRITNAVRCLPPANQPKPVEVATCNAYLAEELAMLPRGAAVLALGNLAHGAVLRALKLKASGYRFRHGAVYRLPGGLALFDSYHCSRYNTQTRRLTPAMFESVFGEIAQYLRSPAKEPPCPTSTSALPAN
jgi:uracil-DNA glycosylase